MSSSTFPCTSHHHPYKKMKHCGKGKIVIRTIIIRNLEEKITETDLTIYFAIFGNITNLSIKESRLRSNRKFALVTYKLPEEAAMALRIKHHKLKGVKLQVAAAERCHQPTLSETVKSPRTDTTISILNSNEPNYSLLSLNDDCLLHVLSFLNLAEQVKVSELCSRLNAIGQIMFRKVKKVNINDMGFETFFGALNIVQDISRYVEHFVISFGGRPRNLYQYCAKFLPPLCSNLKNLELVDINLKRNTYKSLMPVFKDLESLTLKHCRVTDKVLILLKTCMKLKKLDLSGNGDLIGRGFNTLPNTIMELSLSDCTGISESSFIDLCKAAKLKILNINGCWQLDSFALLHLTQVESLEAIHMYNYLDANHLNNHFFEELLRKKSDTLQRLCLSCLKLNHFQRNALCNFSNLKHLCISGAGDDKWLNQLTNSLTYLSIMHSHNISVDAIIKFVERSENIQIIDISYCKQFSSMIVFKLLEILEILRRPTCFKLTAEGTKIPSSVKEDPLYTEMKHLFKLSFRKDNRDCNHEVWAFNGPL